MYDYIFKKSALHLFCSYYGFIVFSALLYCFMIHNTKLVNCLLACSGVLSYL